MKRAHRNEDCAGLVLLEGKEGGVQILDPSPEFGLIAVWREYYHDDELRKNFVAGMRSRNVWAQNLSWVNHGNGQGPGGWMA
jgi:hypothetical protein